MASTINASSTGGGGLITTGDASGQLALQANGTTVATVSSTGLALATNQTINTANTYGFKNRLINGAMAIDQRNGGAAVTINSTAETYTLDRWLAIGQSSAGVYTVDQVQDAPSGFIDSLKVTVTTQDATLGAAEYYWVQQKIEGYNAADLAWGSASAKPVTLSFWVKSSVTGTFSGSFSNSAFTYSYAYEYTINTANTWEQKTISIIGAPAGTWLTTNGIGVRIYWDLGVGTNYTGVAGSWQSAGYTGSTGSTKLIQTLNATWQITGVQLEVGSQATSFDFRSIGQETLLCQRYYWYQSAYPTSYAHFGPACITGSTNVQALLRWNVTMRTQPTITTTAAGTFLIDGSSSFTPSAISIAFITDSTARTSLTISGGTAGQGTFLASQSAGAAAIYYSAEL